MTLREMQDNSGKWAQRKLAEALNSQSAQPTPADCAGLFAILVHLHSSANRDAGVPLESIKVNVEEKRFDIELSDQRYTPNHPDHVDQVIERFYVSVSTMNFGPDGWTLNTIKTGRTVGIRTLELPDWSVIDGSVDV